MTHKHTLMLLDILCQVGLADKIALYPTKLYSEMSLPSIDRVNWVVCRNDLRTKAQVKGSNVSTEAQTVEHLLNESVKEKSLVLTFRHYDYHVPG